MWSHVTEPTDVLTQVAIIQTDSVSIIYCVYQLKAERAASLNYNNKESYGENIYIKPCFISSVIAGPHATAAGQISSPTTAFQHFTSWSTSTAQYCNARPARAARPDIDINNAEVKQTETDYSYRPPHHQSSPVIRPLLVDSMHRAQVHLYQYSPLNRVCSLCLLTTSIVRKSVSQ